jgi:hypothetical protein
MAFKSVRARSDQLTTSDLPLLDLAGELLGRDDAAAVDVLQALLDLVQHVEAIDDLIEWCAVGQSLDGFNRVLFGGVGAHGVVPRVRHRTAC